MPSYPPINASDDLRIGADGATSAWLNGVQVWPPVPPACSFDLVGSLDDGPLGAALSHDGSTLYVGASDGVYTYTFPGLIGPTLLESTNPVIPYSLAVDTAGSVYWWEDVSDPPLKKRTAGGTVTTLFTDTASTDFDYGMIWLPFDSMLWTHHLGELWEIDPGTGSRTVHVTDGDAATAVRPAPTAAGGLFWPAPVITPTVVRYFDTTDDSITDSATFASLPFNEFLPVGTEVWYPRSGTGYRIGPALTEAASPCADGLPFFIFLYVNGFSTVAYIDGADVYLRT